jgi:hypothetical protein
MVLRLVFLGMGLDAAAERFFIPADKLKRLQQELRGLAQQQHVTAARQVAKPWPLAP